MSEFDIPTYEEVHEVMLCPGCEKESVRKYSYALDPDPETFEDAIKQNEEYLFPKSLEETVAPPPISSQVTKTPYEVPNDDDEYTYDVFISYSDEDKEWVRETLKPWLEKTGLRVVIDRDFELGVPHLANMERAVERSRHVLLILTPNWVLSESAEFEALLAQSSDISGLRRRTIPLMRSECEPPKRIAMLTRAKFIQPDNEEWERAVGARFKGGLTGSLSVALRSRNGEIGAKTRI